MVKGNFLQNVDENLISIAIEEYLKHRYEDKYPNDWGERYKYEILEDLNNELSAEEINKDTILDIVKTLQKSNPQSGTFVH